MSSNDDLKLKILAIWLAKNREDSKIGELANKQSRYAHYVNAILYSAMAKYKDLK